MPRGAFYLLFVFSGFAGLIYESVWTQYLKLFLGHSAYAQSVVLAVFMGGMAAGAAWCARHSARIRNALLAYALVEAAIGVAALVFHPVFVALTEWSFDRVFPLLGAGELVVAVKIAIASLLIVPQSVLLGMTFPLMSAALARTHAARAGESVAMLYFTNSLGGAAGVLGSAFLLLPALGLPGALRTAGVLNIVLALCAGLMARPLRDPPLAQEKAPDAALWILGAAFFTGLASFVYEVSWIRMLSLVLGASTHSFEVMLATFILGLALGGLAVRRRVDRTEPARFLGWVQIAMALAALATLPVYNATFDIMQTLMQALAKTDAGYALFNVSGAAIAAIVMLPATFCAGMTLPLLTGALLRTGAGESALGRVYAANTLGAIAGVVLALQIGLPLVGLKGTLMAGCLVDAAVGLALLFLFVDKKTLRLAAGTCAALFFAVGLAVELDANKMTAGVFRYGDLSASEDAQVLYKKDGRTATVHLVKYPEATSLRTNGKSDGSINLDPNGARGSDEITMVLTAALPLSLKPDTRRAAVIGMGTGLTTHTLLQSLQIERVDTVEIEAAMAEAARGFLPRNSAAFADPRGTIVIDDAKTFFTATQNRYELIISEPSNPWVSGVSGLFTREFYRRIRRHLADDGLLAQWFQLYEIDPARVASVMRALGEAFPNYAIFAPSDHDLLIVASTGPIPQSPQARIFEQPGVAKALWTEHLLNAGDLDARYVGNRATLEPLFASYAVPANSDYYPLLDLNAARDRFTDKSAAGVVGLLNADVPVLEMLEPGRSRRPVNPLFTGADDFERVNNTRLAWYARNYLLDGRSADTEGIPAQMEKDLELVRLRLMECRQPRDFDVWLHSAVRVAKALNPYLAPDDAAPVWSGVLASACSSALSARQRRWVELFRAVALRDARAMGELAAEILSAEKNPGLEARTYVMTAGLAGDVASGRKKEALELWRTRSGPLAASPALVFRLLRCHAGDCAGAL
jgi:spermidine synthase